MRAIISVSEAVIALRSGGLVALPTETVYGLAGLASNPSAVESIFKIKKRPFSDPLILHVSSVEQAKACLRTWPSSYEVLAKEFWPGPLTLIGRKQESISDAITAGGDTVAVRMPRQDLFLQVLQELAEPLAAPSANLFGQTSPTRPEHVIEAFGGNVLVVDGGHCQLGIESTVVEYDADLNGIVIYRPGDISKSQLESALVGHCSVTYKQASSAEVLKSPGMILDHYQPKFPLILVEPSYNPSLSEIAQLLNVQGQLNFAMLKLPEDPKLAAQKLYESLIRHSNAANKDCIICQLPKDYQSEEWNAVLDRLIKASSYRMGI